MRIYGSAMCFLLSISPFQSIQSFLSFSLNSPISFRLFFHLSISPMLIHIKFSNILFKQFIQFRLYRKFPNQRNKTCECEALNSIFYANLSILCRSDFGVVLFISTLLSWSKAESKNTEHFHAFRVFLSMVYENAESSYSMYRQIGATTCIEHELDQWDFTIFH